MLTIYFFINNLVFHHHYFSFIPRLYHAALHCFQSYYNATTTMATTHPSVNKCFHLLHAVYTEVTTEQRHLLLPIDNIIQEALHDRTTLQEIDWRGKSGVEIEQERRARFYMKEMKKTLQTLHSLDPPYYILEGYLASSTISMTQMITQIENHFATYFNELQSGRTINFIAIPKLQRFIQSILDIEVKVIDAIFSEQSDIFEAKYLVAHILIIRHVQHLLTLVHNSRNDRPPYNWLM